MFVIRLITLLMVAFLTSSFLGMGSDKDDSKTASRKEAAQVSKGGDQSSMRQENSASGTRPLAIPVVPKIPHAVDLKSFQGTNMPQGLKENAAATAVIPAVKPQFPGVPKLPTPPVSNAAIKAIQKQITEIIHLNESLKQRHHEDVAEIQRIMEQAEHHRKILEDINASRRKILEAKGAALQAKSNPLNSEDANTDDLVRQEKVRLISSQTQKNREYIESLGQSGAARKGNQETILPSKAS